jgi:hypothetical protein
MILNQKRLFTKRHIELKNEGFIYTESSFLNQIIEADFPYEELRVNLIYKRSQVPLFWLGMTALWGFFFFAALIPKVFIPETKADWTIIIGLGIATMVFSFLSYFNWINEVHIGTTRGDIALFRSKNNAKEVDEFIKLLRTKARQYVTAKYSAKLKGQKELQEERIGWLFEAGFISENEFEKLKNSLLPHE